MWDVISFALLCGLWGAVVVGFYEIDKAIKKKAAPKYDADLVEIKMELENISAEISAVRTGISLLNDKLGPSKGLIDEY